MMMPVIMAIITMMTMLLNMLQMVCKTVPDHEEGKGRN